MTDTIDRRGFVSTSCGLAAGASLGAFSGSLATAVEPLKCSTPSAEKIGWRVAAQLYTFRAFSFYEALEMITSLGVRNVEPCFFLRLDKDRPELKVCETLSPKDRRELKKRLKGVGVKMPVFYSNLAEDEAENRKKFEFAKEMGVEAIVSEPPAEAFDMIEKLCDEYKINLAVHNHPESPKSKYWNPESVLEVCRGRGPRIGACCDTGHWVRSGLNAVECLKKMEGRILSFHLKDVPEVGNPKARDVPLGTGKADYAAVLGELNRQGYKGVMSIEYEHQSPELVDEVAQCLAFVEKTASHLAG